MLYVDLNSSENSFFYTGNLPTILPQVAKHIYNPDNPHQHLFIITKLIPGRITGGQLIRISDYYEAEVIGLAKMEKGMAILMLQPTRGPVSWLAIPIRHLDTAITTKIVYYSLYWTRKRTIEKVIKGAPCTLVGPKKSTNLLTKLDRIGQKISSDND